MQTWLFAEKRGSKCKEGPAEASAEMNMKVDTVGCLAGARVEPLVRRVSDRNRMAETARLGACM